MAQIASVEHPTFVGCVGAEILEEIADRLNIGIETVRTHVHHIYEKLHVQSRTEAVVKVIHNQRSGRGGSPDAIG